MGRPKISPKSRTAADEQRRKSRPFTRPVLERIHAIAQELQRGSYPNCGSLAARFEVVRRTIIRDLNFMRDRQGLPIGFDRKRNGYFYTEPVASIPALQVAEGELLALFIAERSASFDPLSETARNLHSIAYKLGALMPDTVTLSLDDLNTAITIQPGPTFDLDIECVRLLGRAITQRTAVTFSYPKSDGPGMASRTVWPLKLFTREGAWYVLTYDPSRKNTRTFHLSRMKSLTVGRERFMPPPGIDGDLLLKSSFGVYFNRSKRFKVELFFDSGAGKLVAERNWHSSQKNKWMSDGRLSVRFTVSAIQDVVRWILSWSPQVEVRGPAELRAAVFEATKAMAQRHKK